MAWEKLYIGATARSSKPEIAMNKATTTVNKSAKAILGPGARYEIWVDKDSRQIGFKPSQESPFRIPARTNASKVLDTVLKAMGVKPGERFDLIKSADPNSPVAYHINLPFKKKGAA